MLFIKALIPKISMDCQLIFEHELLVSNLRDKTAVIFDIQLAQMLREHKAA